MQAEERQKSEISSWEAALYNRALTQAQGQRNAAAEGFDVFAVRDMHVNTSSCA
jgi:hypothetical protein